MREGRDVVVDRMDRGRAKFPVASYPSTIPEPPVLSHPIVLCVLCCSYPRVRFQVALQRVKGLVGLAAKLGVRVHVPSDFTVGSAVYEGKPVEEEGDEDEDEEEEWEEEDVSTTPATLSLPRCRACACGCVVAKCEDKTPSELVWWLGVYRHYAHSRTRTFVPLPSPPHEKAQTAAASL